MRIQLTRHSQAVHSQRALAQVRSIEAVVGLPLAFLYRSPFANRPTPARKHWRKR